MKPPRRHSLASRYLSLFAGGILLFVGGTGAVQYHALRSRLNEDVAETARDILSTVDAVVDQRPDLIGTPRLADILQRVSRASPAAARVWVADPSGRVTGDSALKSDPARVIRSTALLDGAIHSSFYDVGGHTYFSSVQMVRAPQSTGVAVIGVELSFDSFQRGPAEDLAVNMALTCIVLLLVTIPALFLTSRMIFAPLITIARTAREFGETGKAVRLEIHTGDEIEELANALNEAAAARTRVEKALIEERARAEDASRAKSDFLANMSHEIRTPMNGVIGMLDLALDTPLDADQRDYLETAAASAEALLCIINDILDFSKIEAGKLDLDHDDFLLSEGMSDALAALALRAHRQNLELTVDIEPDVPDALLGDIGRLRQVIVNIVGNAIKFTRAGEVKLHVGVESLHDTHVDLRFIITDTGIGISKAKQAVVFEAFAQGDASTTRQFGGTGLGLTISSQLVEMMGGRIWVESELDHGSKFCFTSRFGHAASTASATALQSPESLQGVKVLVVDDNVTNRRILETMLTRWGMKPTMAASGMDALDLLKEASSYGEKFQLLLVDAVMPEMDGFALVEHIRTECPADDMLIMMLSSAGQKEALARCRDLGVSLYLTKPVRQSQLLRFITEALSIKVPATPPLVSDVISVTRPEASLRVLVAEDNLVNQRVACGLLERRGHSVVCASNGREALALFDRQVFDLVLMDVQMPEMGGFEVTAEIRRREMTTGRHVPVIALTARAMKGDLEECLAAGMNAYMSKPIRARELYETIAAVCGAPGLPVRSIAAVTPDGVIDVEALMNLAGGDVDLLSELTSLFASESSLMLVQLRDAVAAEDNDALEATAHSLKGSAGTLTGYTTSRHAGELERLARNNEAYAAGPVLDELERALSQFNLALNNITILETV
jgi:two-component system sensor histidine kinase/response regulator